MTCRWLTAASGDSLLGTAAVKILGLCVVVVAVVVVVVVAVAAAVVVVVVGLCVAIRRQQHGLGRDCHRDPGDASRPSPLPHLPLLSSPRPISPPPVLLPPCPSSPSTALLPPLSPPPHRPCPRDRHSASTPSPSLLKRLLDGEAGAAEWQNPRRRPR